MSNKLAPHEASTAPANDGQVRLTADELKTVRLVHLLSGMDEDVPPGVAEAAMETAITGYTEWVSEGEPVITLGWDWAMLAAASRIGLRRLGEPRSNVMLLGANRADLGHAKTSLCLEMLIDAKDWQEAALRHLRTRYG